MNKPLLFEIPEGTDPSRCSGCKALIYWIKTDAGKNMPVDPDGTSHFATCPKASSFRHYDPSKDVKRTRQKRLFEECMQRQFRMTTWEKNFINNIILPKFNGKPRKLTNAEDAALEKIHEDRVL